MKKAHPAMPGGPFPLSGPGASEVGLMRCSRIGTGLPAVPIDRKAISSQTDVSGDSQNNA
jgi:hypothetical protein